MTTVIIQLDPDEGEQAHSNTVRRTVVHAVFFAFAAAGVLAYALNLFDGVTLDRLLGEWRTGVVLGIGVAIALAFLRYREAILDRRRVRAGATAMAAANAERIEDLTRRFEGADKDG